MDCPLIPELGVAAFSRRMHESVVRDRIPLVGSIELTNRCNLHCQHCYLDGAHNVPAGQKELSADEINYLFSQVVDEGTLWMLLTGGEPLLRRDFKQIYTSAKRKGLLVSLFTNGTLITERLADLLAEWRPFTIEITLYGHTQATYERVSGVSGSHTRCRAGIERLLERKLPLTLKTMLMSLNQHELWEMQAYARSLGVHFRYDALLNGGIDGSRQPIELRIAPEEVVEFDIQDAQRIEEWRSFCKRYEGHPADAQYVYACGAGVNSYHIDPYGQLSMCMLSRLPAYDLRQGSFRQGWREFLPEYRFQPAMLESECDRCELYALCGQCPGWSQLEGTPVSQPVEYLCRVARLRAQAIGFTGAIPYHGFQKTGQKISVSE
jgi:radical SAM protein with 4Fe4S-binding SPASM domain